MRELQGKYVTAKVFTDVIEPGALQQIEHLLNQEFISGSKIRIMPDVHAGMGCTIGTTMTIKDKVVPNLVGVDIGCGMETVLLKDKRVDLNQLDKAIHQHVPAGFKTRNEPHHYNDDIDLTALRCAKHVDINRAQHSLGTLGGGNHFIELGTAENGDMYLVVHSGSRNLGKQVCEFYQNKAADTLIKKTNADRKKFDRVLAYLEGEPFHDYLHDMAIIQRYASLNRQAIINVLEKKAKLKIADAFTTIHNYIDLDAMILRKGAISAQAGERVLIPLNMRDGSLICIGKGNDDWNRSAPHGAGRIMSRTEAKNTITLSQYEKSMKGIFSSTINRSTLDEAPFAYKAMNDIVQYIGDTVDIVQVVKPLYNFKSAE
ncbi:MAG: RtcB family protein [Defluviitaleaceae bacterium]|nr:RtcB family protein [Defluviitaleaceae bacterium]